MNKLNISINKVKILFSLSLLVGANYQAGAILGSQEPMPELLMQEAVELELESMPNPIRGPVVIELTESEEKPMTSSSLFGCFCFDSKSSILDILFGTD